MDKPSQLRWLELRGAAIAPYVQQLAALRIEVFREWPYLYQGSAAYEQEYLQHFLTSPNSYLALAMDSNTVVGATSAMPLQEESQELRQPFIQAGLPLEGYFYFAETVLQANYRGLGLGKAAFALRETEAVRQGFKHVTFCRVERSSEQAALGAPFDAPTGGASEMGTLGAPSHSAPTGGSEQATPKNYRPLDGFWQQQGFAPSHLVAHMSWQDIDKPQPDYKPLRFWLKELA